MERDVQFIVPDVSCSNKQELWYHVPEPTRQTKMTKTFTCKVKSSSHCITQTRPGRSDDISLMFDNFSLRLQTNQL